MCFVLDMFSICWVLLCSKRSIFSRGRMFLWAPVEDGFVFGTFFFFLNGNANFINHLLLKNSKTSFLPVHGLWKLNFFSFLAHEVNLDLKAVSCPLSLAKCVCKQEIIETNDRNKDLQEMFWSVLLLLCVHCCFPFCYPPPQKKPSRKKWSMQLLRLLIHLTSWFINWNYSGSWWLVWENDNELYFPNKIQFYPSLFV